MNLKQISNKRWYLAQYVTTGKNRELLFSWLNERQVTPWTPMVIKSVPRADSHTAVRRKVQAIFPGYFFLKANLDVQSSTELRLHSAFVDFVRRGRTILPVQDEIVSGLMKIYPDPSQNPHAADEISDAADVWLSDSQYRKLLTLDKQQKPESRIILLLEYLSRPEHHGFSAAF